MLQDRINTLSPAIQGKGKKQWSEILSQCSLCHGTGMRFIIRLLQIIRSVWAPVFEMKLLLKWFENLIWISGKCTFKNFCVKQKIVYFQPMCTVNIWVFNVYQIISILFSFMPRTMLRKYFSVPLFMYFAQNFTVQDDHSYNPPRNLVKKKKTWVSPTL